MGRFTQANRPLAVTTPLGPDVLLLERIQGSEYLSGLFQFQLDMLAEAQETIPFDKLLGQKVTVRLDLGQGSRRYVNGIISHLTQGAKVHAAANRGTFIRYRAVLVPQFWLLSKNLLFGIYQEKNVPDILRQVLAELDVGWHLQGTYPQRNYCVQYHESSFHFASRLLEDEGIYYYFAHDDGHHQLILADNPEGHQAVPGAATVSYEEVEGGVRADNRVLSWEKVQEIRAGQYTLRDYTFEMPDHDLEARQKIVPALQAGTVHHALNVGGAQHLEIFDFPGGYAHFFDSVGPGGSEQANNLGQLFEENQRLARLRMQAEAVPGLLCQGSSTCPQFTAGHGFTLRGHDHANGAYVLTRVDHDASMEGAYLTETGGTFSYHNHFQCLPAAQPFRPSRGTPRPTVAGPQPALVVGPPEEEIFTDKYGRIKVQFYWDRQGKKDGNTSCWLRVGQPWAGKGWGAITIPRVGHEVAVAFWDGNPDRPFVTGSVFNADNLPPFTLPEQAMFSGFKTQSVSGGQGNFSGLAFSDLKGQEHVHLHAERDLRVLTENNHVVTVGASQHVVVNDVCLQVVGSLPGSGGSGSGGDDATYTSPFNWTAGDVSSHLGKSLVMVFGEQTTVVGGLLSTFTFGDKVDIIVNPLGFLAGGAGSPLLKGFAGLMGRIGLVVGGATDFVYGQKLAIHRGFDWKPLNNVNMTPIEKALVGVLSLLATGNFFVFGALGPSEQAGLVSAYIWGGAVGLVLAALILVGIYKALAKLGNAIIDAISIDFGDLDFTVPELANVGGQVIAQEF